MKVSFDSSFYKRLEKIKDKEILEKLKQIIILVENAPSLQHIPNIKR